MNHLELYQIEIHMSESTENWLKWCEKTEGLLGHSLDGEGNLSLDFAYERYLAGCTPQRFIEIAVDPRIK